MLTRRQFIKLCIAGGVGAGLANSLLPQVARALESLGKRPVVVWLECMTCTGDYLSFMNSLHPQVSELVTEVIDFRLANTMMSAEGVLVLDVIDQVIEEEKGKYILIVEGTIPLRDDGMWMLVGHRAEGTPVTALEAFRRLATDAAFVLAAGSCAAHGGPFNADPNPSQSVAANQVVDVPVINVPGCPVHPDWIVGTLSHVMLFGPPNLDVFNRPTLFYGDLIHDNCPRRQHFENSVFAKFPGDDGCLYKIGCKGPVTFSDCPTRQWIGEHNNWPVEANTPCIGCVNPGFPDQMEPFFQRLPNLVLPAVNLKAKRVGQLAVGTALTGIGIHYFLSSLAGRLHKSWVGGTETKVEKIADGGNSYTGGSEPGDSEEGYSAPHDSNSGRREGLLKRLLARLLRGLRGEQKGY